MRGAGGAGGAGGSVGFPCQPQWCWLTVLSGDGALLTVAAAAAVVMRARLVVHSSCAGGDAVMR